MSAAEETIKATEISKSKGTPVVNRFLDFMSSVRLGVVLLCILVVLSMIGMLIIQQNVQGFEPYYASLTPAEKLVFGYLGFFDIYYSWYFNLLLLVLSLNIVLASIDRFPSAWSYISRPKLVSTRGWLLNQKENATLTASFRNEKKTAEKIRQVFEANGFKAQVSSSKRVEYAIGEDGKKNFSDTVTREDLCVFGQAGRINRMGPYIVHVALLTLFLGNFVANQTGFDADVRMIPGTTTDKIQMIKYDLDKKEKFDVQLPFSMTTTEIQQSLIDSKGAIDVTNTLDWRTQMKVDDPLYGSQIADISMNKPFNYRGYRFFQAQFVNVGNARSITLELKPQNGGEAEKIQIQRTGSAFASDGTNIEYEEFLPDFTFNSNGKPDTRSGDYNNPVAVLGVTPPQGTRTRVFAFAAKVADNIPVGAPKAGFKWRLTDFEKSPFAHILTIKYDPYNAAFIAWYFGGFGLLGALSFVFFFSHKRIWALLEKREDGEITVVLGGHTNRNQIGFQEKFAKIVKEMKMGGE